MINLSDPRLVQITTDFNKLHDSKDSIELEIIMLQKQLRSKELEKDHISFLMKIEDEKRNIVLSEILQENNK